MSPGVVWFLFYYYITFTYYALLRLSPLSVSRQFDSSFHKYIYIFFVIIFRLGIIFSHTANENSMHCVLGAVCVDFSVSPARILSKMK